METVRLARAEDAAPLARLLSDELGAGMYLPGRIGADISDPGARVVAADLGGALVGGAISRLLGPDDAGYYDRFGSAATEVFRVGPVGSFEAVAVVDAARGQGIGLALLEDALAWFRKQGCTTAVGISWVSGRRGSSGGLFRRAGFDAGRTIPGFFLEDSLRNGWTCPVCQGPCRCPAQFVHRPL